jgi:hypothetical protein
MATNGLDAIRHHRATDANPAGTEHQEARGRLGLGQIAPEAEFRVWTAAEDLYPHTVLLAAESVHAANAQGLEAGEALDLALRPRPMPSRAARPSRATIEKA